MPDWCDAEVAGKSCCPAGLFTLHTARHADFEVETMRCILIKLRFAGDRCRTLHNWRIRLVVYGARLESVLV